MAFSYDQLTAAEQVAMIDQRMRELEQQRMMLDLRVNAPDVSAPPSQQDQDNITFLDGSIQKLRNMKNALSPQPPAPSP